MAWKLKGTYFESCNCDLTCPCIFLSSPTEGECKAMVGWHIENGRDGDISLNGLNVAVALHSPGHMMETPWRAAVYIDNRASEAQQQSLINIFSGQAGGHPARIATHIGEVLGVKAVPIEFSTDGKSYSLKIAGTGETEIEQVTGQGDGPIAISGHPLCIAPGYPAMAAKSKKVDYSDHGLSFSLSEKSGLFSPFSYESE